MVERAETRTNATLLQRHEADERTLILRVRPDFGALSFLAGQWTELGLSKAENADDWGPTGDEYEKDGVVRRAYSICSKPGDEVLEFVFTLVPHGQLTRWLWQLREGDRLYIDPEARGHFTFDDLPDGNDILMVATGSGVAPFVSLVSTYIARGKWRRAMLLHGAKTRAQLAFEDHFRVLETLDDSFTYCPTLTREAVPEGWCGEGGRVSSFFTSPERFMKERGIILDPASCDVFLCGSNAMIQEVEDLLMPLGFRPKWMDPKGTLHAEIYY